jgi:hypothetical protein
LARKPVDEVLLETSRHKLEYNIKMGLKIIGQEGVDWIHLA